MELPLPLSLPLLLPPCEKSAIARDHERDPAAGGRGGCYVALWCLFAAFYLALFLFNVSMIGFHFASGSIDAAEAATSFVFCVTGLAGALALFLFNTCLAPRAWICVLFFLFGLAALGRASLLYARQQLAFSLCFGAGSVASLLLTRSTWHHLSSIDPYLPIGKPAAIV